MHTTEGAIRKGWLCAALRVEDTFITADGANTGNVGISAPLRLCYGTLSGSGPSATCEGMPAPSCTDGCVITDDQRWPEGMLWDDLQ
jgi:hypothetical protein